MKINVALFITALSTAGRRHGVLPVVSAASAAAGDDAAAAAATTTTVDRPHLRALLQDDDPRLAACSAPVQNGSCDNMFCNNCNQGQTQCTAVDGCMTNNGLSSLYSVCGDASWYGVACCNAGKTKCYDPQGSIPEISLFIQSEEEDTDKLGDEIEAVVPSSSTLRASSLLKDNNVFTKQDGDETENFLEVGTCGPSNDAPSDPCTAEGEHYYLDCSGCSGKTLCVSSSNSSSDGFGTLNQWSARCCNQNNPDICADSSAQAEEEDAASLLKVE